MLYVLAYSTIVLNTEQLGEHCAQMRFEHCMNKTPSDLFENVDVVSVLAQSTIMLNTDQVVPPRGFWFQRLHTSSMA